MPEQEKIDDFTKPSRQNRGGKKRQSQEKDAKVRREPYKRQRFHLEDVDDIEEEKY